jgi:hypothetical protein
MRSFRPATANGSAAMSSSTVSGSITTPLEPFDLLAVRRKKNLAEQTRRMRDLSQILRNLSGPLEAKKSQGALLTDAQYANNDIVTESSPGHNKRRIIPDE